MAAYFDALETRSAEERERALMAALSRQIAHAKAHAESFAELLADVDPRAVIERAALAKLPVTRKHRDFMRIVKTYLHRRLCGPQEEVDLAE